MKAVLNVILNVCFVLLFSQCIAQTKNDLSAKDFQAEMTKSKDAVILDVREQDEANVMGAIKNSLRIDFYKSDFETQLSQLDPNKTYFVYCAGGVRSAKTCKILNDKGFKNVYNLKGGFSAWESAKLPIEMPKAN